MKAARPAALLFLGLACGCDGGPLSEAVPAPVEYRPQEAGTVDHAMCLLGFMATPMRGLVTGHQIVDASLNGRPASFILDTGANVTVVHAGFAEEFGLSARGGLAGAAVGLGGGMQASRSAIDALQIGSVKVRQRHVMVADLSQLEMFLGRLSRRPIHGIIGQDVLKEHRAVIDVARPMLYLRQEDSAPEPAPPERCRARAGKAAPNA